MDKLWKPIALGRLDELQKRVHEISSPDKILSAIDGLDLPAGLKRDIQRQILSRGVVLAPAPAGWAQLSPGQAIDFAIEKIRDYKGED